MDTIQFLREKKLLAEDKESFKIIHDEAGEISLNELLEEWSEEVKNSHLRLAADFENYKKRVQKEKEELINNTKVRLLQSILDMDNDLSFAIKSSKDEVSEGVKLIVSKLDSFLKAQGIEPIQTENYDEDLHEVISVIPMDETKVVDVVSKGYTLNGKPFRYPKIILGKNA
jgi:molecular chaperone GrpE